jgi:DNA helicase-2/ATP-dependent DNA helicase PcrA
MSFPSEEQKMVIEHRGRPLIVVAGPGTGKTATLVERMISLLSEDPGRKVSFITFTKPSRRDTRSKIEDALGITALAETEFEFPRISTLHGYAKGIVHRYAATIGRRSDFSVLLENRGEKLLILEELISDLELEIDTLDLSKSIACFRAKNRWPDDFQATDSERAQILKHFEALLVFYNTFDMEGLVTAACSMLEDTSNVLPAIYLQVDEYQDLNPADQKLVQLAASNPDSEVVVVGDDAQSIYLFRHANYEGLHELWDSPDWDQISFSECYRLPAHINNAAQALIENEGYLGGRLNPCPDNGKRILTLQCTKSNLQVNAIAKQIRNLKSQGRNRKGEPLTYKDFMVLCPTSAFVNNIANTLQTEFDIPTKRKQPTMIPDDHWRLLLILRMLHSEDSLALRQWLSIANLTDLEISEIRHEAISKNESLYDYCESIGDSRIRAIYDSLDSLRAALSNLDEFRRRLKQFPNLLVEDELFPEVGLTIDEATHTPRSVASVIKFIYEKFGLIEPEGDIPEDDKVLIASLHSAKGIEADFVFVTYMNSRYMPMPDRDVSEERRLLYVALTRAKQDVILTFHEVFDPSSKRCLRQEAMSLFLHEIKEHLDLQQIRAKDVC